MCGWRVWLPMKAIRISPVYAPMACLELFLSRTISRSRTDKRFRTQCEAPPAKEGLFFCPSVNLVPRHAKEFYRPDGTSGGCDRRNFRDRQESGAGTRTG